MPARETEQVKAEESVAPEVAPVEPETAGADKFSQEGELPAVAAAPAIATGVSASEQAFAGNEPLRGYIVDERFRLRKHVVIFVDNQPITDREGLSDAVGPTSEIYVLQALSGG